jgi:mannose-6-phosphate isomerase-like protein (cupin superfamily)
MTTTTRRIRHLVAGAGESVPVLTDTLTFKVVSAESDGIYLVAEGNSPPGSGPPAPHQHPAQETFYIIEGDLEFTGIDATGPYTFRATAGDVVHIPGNTPHNYRNTGAIPSRYLVTLSPGSMEQFFREMSTLMMPPEMAKVMEITGRHDVSFVGGPPQPPPH